MEFLVAGRESPFDFRRESPRITEITQRLLELREDQLERLWSVIKPIQREEPDEIAERMEKLTDLLTGLAKHVEGSKMTRKDKEKTKDLLNRIVLNIYEQKLE